MGPPSEAYVNEPVLLLNLPPGAVRSILNSWCASSTWRTVRLAQNRRLKADVLSLPRFWDASRKKEDNNSRWIISDFHRSTGFSICSLDTFTHLYRINVDPNLWIYHWLKLVGRGQVSFGSCDTLTSEQDVQCPGLQVDEWKFPQTAQHNVTGFNLVRRFALLKSADVKKIRNPRGPVILRLGKTALLRPTDQVFPHGLPEEFTLVFTLALKKAALRETIYLFQISDQQGYPQLSVDFNGPDGTLSLRARGVDPTVDPVSCVFSGEGVEALMDFRWHKVALSVQQDSVSLHVDCSSIETKPLDPRGPLPIDGHTLLGVRASDAGAAQMDIQQVMLYCDPSLAIQEACCEIPGARCPPDTPKNRRAAENDLLENTFSQ
ncbi:LOW QUALITY PROTEIN: collagen alpha-1(XVI) chain, partial [Xyrichtys novacula]